MAEQGDPGYALLCGDALKVLRTLGAGSANMCVTSPAYFGLRDYGVEGQLGLEPTPDEYIAKLVAVFREVRRVLRDDGTLWLNIADSYAGGGGFCATSPSNLAGAKQTTMRGSIKGSIRPGNGLKPKDLIGIPWMLAFALRADGWWLRQDIIWAKGLSGALRAGSCMPESVTDRCTKAHEYIFLLSKGPKYYYDNDAVKEKAVQPDRARADRMGGNKYVEVVKHSDGSTFTGAATGNRRDVWFVNPKPFRGAHFAAFPPDLIRPCIRAGSRPGGLVLDPFSGSGTTGLVCMQEGRNYVGIDLNIDYVAMAARRLAADVLK